MMKIKMWDRVILFAGALLTVVTGVLLFIQGVQAGNALFIICALLAAAFGVYLVIIPRRYYVKRNNFVIQRTDSGELRIAVRAIENQVQRCIDLHEEIQVSVMNILSTREGVVVDLTVALANNISIPLAVASLQKQIKQYLIASSGIEVKEVRVSVESTQAPDPDDAPEAEGEQAAEAAAAREAKEKKAPLHQRLFGKADEPAIVPEPPKEEEAPVTEDEEAATEAETEEAAEVEEARQQPVPAPAEPEEEPAAAPAGEEPEAEEAPEAEAEETQPLPGSDILPESEELTNE